MRYSNPNMLIYIAMADAFAHAVEYNDTLRDRVLPIKKYFAHPTHGLAPGAYTDDTEMSIANAKVLIRYFDQPFTPLMFAEAYVREFQLGGCRKGYAPGFQAFLEQVQTGDEFLSKIRPDSVKNGAAMRAAVFGVLRTVEDVLEVATLQARITHDTPEGRFSARAVALMSHAALYEDLPLSNLGDYCKQYLPTEDLKRFGYVFDQRWSGDQVRYIRGVSVAITTVHAVVELLTRQKSLMDMLRQTILWGGDTDSVAAIAWGIASARHQNEVIPLFMLRDLEGGSRQTGTFNLSIIGTMLMAKYKGEKS